MTAITHAVPAIRRARAATPFAAALALSGLFFVLYPAIRPFSSERGIEGARAFASSSWVVAHTLGIVGFVLLGVGVLGIQQRLRESAGGDRGLKALVLFWVGAGLTLPFYGAEVFGLHAVGRHVLAHHDAALLKPLTDSMRGSPGIWFIVIGLLLLAAGAIVLAAAIWRSRTMPRWAGVPLAAGLALYLPQFTGPQPLRLVHGLLMLVGCCALAWNLRRAGPEATR